VRERRRERMCERERKKAIGEREREKNSQGIKPQIDKTDPINLFCVFSEKF